MAYSGNTIKVKKYSDHIEEIDAGGTITPGMLVNEGSAGTVAAHGTAAGNVIPRFALEDGLQGKEITDNYVSGDKVQVWTPYRGDQVYALLADGQNVAIGAMLESAGDGTLRAWTSSTNPRSIVAEAVEALDLSASANTTSGRIVVRIV